MVEIVARNRDEIRRRLLDSPIHLGQLDVNGLCNARCWFCPVKYLGNPKEFINQIDIKSLNQILEKIRLSSLISTDFNNIYTAHYNEILLYAHFSEMIHAFRRYNFVTGIFSNGTPLTPKKADIIIENPDVIKWISLNIPALEKNDWSRKTGMAAQLHDGLMRNLDYLHENYHGRIEFQINSMTDGLANLQNSLVNSEEQLSKIIELVRDRYPRFEILNKNNMLVDRAGLLEELDVLSIHKKTSNPVIGCGRHGSRVFGWFHINAKGDLFLCCDDYNMEYTFGNLLNESFDDIWLSEKHIDTIMLAFGGLCRGCSSRIE